MTRFVRAVFSFGFLAVAASSLAAQDTAFRGITITGVFDPLHDKLGIVVLPVAGAFGDSIRAIIQRDLDFSDQFIVIGVDSTDPGGFRAPGGSGLNYGLFSTLKATVVVEITSVASGLHVALHDVAKAGVAVAKEYPLPTTALNRDWRMGIHRASDDIQRLSTGSNGIAATRIAYMRGASIRVVDSDGADEITVPTEELGISPAWNSAGNMLVYTTFGVSSTGVASHIVAFDMATARSRVVVPPGRNGQLISPIFSPDGSSIIYSRRGENGSNLFAVPIAGGASRQITTTPPGTENTNPTMSPDGRRIVFVSGRSGHPELYIMDADGTNVSVLTDYSESDKNYRSDPDWSPDGQKVAYQERIRDTFQITTILVSGSTPKVLTNDGENEQPSWAPDGRHLVFTSTRTGVRQLWVVDTQSNRLRQLTKSAGSRLAAWSPRLAP